MKSPVVLVTGASAGIGLSLSEEYARRGARVVMLARRLDRLTAAAERLGGLALQCDVSVDGDVERAVAETLQRFGRIDVAIANAGISVAGTVERLELEDFRRQMEVNVFGVIRTVKAVLGPLRASRGRLGIVGSVNGQLPMPGLSAYVMSKFAVRGFAESLVNEVASAGISVTHVMPGFVESDLRLLDNDGKMRPDAKDPVPSWLVMSGKVAARQIADAIEARLPEVVITNHGKVATLLARLTPGLVRRAMGLRSQRGMSPTGG